MKIIFYLAIVVLAVAADCRGATHYVVTNGTPGWIGAVDPYTNWATAGTNIIDVVNTAMTNPASRVVWVTNGTYYPTNVINITNALTLQSVNGRDVTILAGQGSVNTNRCAYFSGTGSKTIDGFTITNYYVTGQKGTVYGDDLSVLNCLFINNSNVYTISQTGQGGGLSINYSGIITNCIFKNNYSDNSGGALEGFYTTSLRIENCTFDGNLMDAKYASGGGAMYFNECKGVTISNCAIVNNRVRLNGAGIYFGAGGYYTTNRVLNCSIVGNVATNTTVYDESIGGGILHRVYSSKSILIVANCSIISNRALASGGGIYGASITIQDCLIAANIASRTNGGGVWLTNSTIENCTIVSNYAAVSGGGIYINGSGSGTNNIVYYNTAGVGANNFTNTAGNTGLHYSCVIPAVDGARNITNDPSLVNLDGGDYRLKGNSPCVNAGFNQNWMTNAVDLDGRSRIRYGTVDMGAYERINAGVIYTVH